MRFKSTQNIFKDFGEVFETKWMDSNKVQTPPNPKWDYSRELQIEDVDIWEVLYERSGGVGVYASWCPYAEFYLIKTGLWDYPTNIETYYGAGAEKKVRKRMDELGLSYSVQKHWVNSEDMWLFT